MKSISFYVKKLDGGGAERVLITYLNELKDYNIEISLFILIKTGVLINEIPDFVKVKYGFLGNEFLKSKNPITKKIYKIYRRLFLNILDNNKKMINTLFLKNNSDIEVSFLQDFAHSIAYSKNKTSEKVIWVHNNIDKIQSIKKNDLIDYLRKADKIITVSNGLKQLIIKSEPALKNKTEVIYNPIDTTNILEQSNNQVIQLNGFSFITMGRLEEQKGYDLLIDSFKLLNEEYPNTYLYILGKGKLEEKIKEQIKNLKLDKNVILLGFKQNPFSYLKAADVFVLSSIYEGLSNVLIEALALNKPIISTNCPYGPWEVLDSGQYGLLVPTGSVKDLYLGMKLIFENEEIRKSYITNSINRSLDFMPKKIIKEFANLVGIDSVKSI